MNKALLSFLLILSIAASTVSGFSVAQSRVGGINGGKRQTARLLKGVVIMLTYNNSLDELFHHDKEVSASEVFKVKSQKADQRNFCLMSLHILKYLSL